MRFCITVAELHQMKSVVSLVWLPSARLPGTQGVVQPVCGHTDIRAVAGCCQHIRCDGVTGVCVGLLE